MTEPVSAPGPGARPRRLSARMLRRLLWLQALGGLGVAWAALHWWRIPVLPALALGALAVVLVRLLISANNFRISRRFGSPVPPEFQLTMGGALRLFWGEFKASMLSSSWHMVHAHPRAQIFPESQSLPVLLLHGYGCNSGYWSSLLPRLDAASISHATLDLEPLFASIDHYVPAIEQAVAELSRVTGQRQVVLIAHSMGGLAARAWVRDHGWHRCAHLVTLGSPHHGTRLAGLGAGTNARQMQCGSAWLAELAGGEDAAARARITSLYTWHDNIVTPQTSSHLPGARNIALGGVGHVALAHARPVLDLLLRTLADLNSLKK